MIASKHTPGPWITEAVGGWIEVQNEETLYTIAKINGNGAGPHANASLIAAAPELLEALEDLVANVTEAMKTGGWVPTPLHKSFWLSMTDASVAIAKATGSAA